jgi:cell division protein FtsN
MKYISLFAIIFAALMITACGAKEEETQDLPEDNEIVEIDYDDTIKFPEWSENDEYNMAPEDTTFEENNVVEETKEDLSQIEEKKVVEEKPVVKKEPVVHQKRFYVVVGSFKKYSNAQKLHKYFKDKGYFPLILPKVNEYNRVAISSYVEEANARKAIKKLRIDHNDLTFWLYKW